MPVTPFGTKYAIGAGNNNHSRIPNRDRRATFRTITPDGRRVKITMNVRGTFQEPCVIFSDETGEWRQKQSSTRIICQNG
jgi:hypothetical protein